MTEPDLPVTMLTGGDFDPTPDTDGTPVRFTPAPDDDAGPPLICYPTTADLELVARATGGGIRSAEVLPKYEDDEDGAGYLPMLSEPHSVAATIDLGNGLHLDVDGDQRAVGIEYLNGRDNALRSLLALFGRLQPVGEDVYLAAAEAWLTVAGLNSFDCPDTPQALAADDAFRKAIDTSVVLTEQRLCLDAAEVMRRARRREDELRTDRDALQAAREVAEVDIATLVDQLRRTEAERDASQVYNDHCQSVADKWCASANAARAERDTLAGELTQAHRLASVRGAQVLHAEGVIRLVRDVLANLAGTCRYHGTDFGRLGQEPWGEPRCESCRQPWRATRALEALARYDRSVAAGTLPAGSGETSTEVSTGVEA
jgi:hypothetical protein